MAHYETTYGTVFRKGGESYSPDFAAIARGYGMKGIKITSASEFKEALAEAIASQEPCASM